MKQGFSLVELSIVLVILGLLTGGILTGQSLIRASELRAVTTEYQRYQTAIQTFRDKYFSIPGDMTNATAFWGKDNTNCSGNTGSVGSPGTCNGNGDGISGNAGAANATGEMFQLWKQLALAGLIEGSYSGLSGTAGAIDTVPGTNSPTSKLSSGAWGIQYLGNYGGDAATYTYNYGNTMVFGGTYAGAVPYNGILKPEEAWNIDTKLDDGKPGTGKLFARDFYNFTAANACTTSTSQTDYAGTYKLTVSALSCALYFARAF